MRFAKILVPLDGSEVSEAILGQVRRIFGDAEVVLLRALDLPADLDAGAEVAQAAAELKRVASKIPGARSLVEIGRPAEVILDVAEREKPTLIAMSTHGRSGIRRWAFGGVTEKILRSRCPVPLLLVRGGVPARELTLRRILVPIDGSPASHQAIAPAAALARLFDAKVVVLSVEETAPEFPMPADSRDRLGSALEELKREGIDSVGVLLGGDPAEQILVASDAHSIDLIAMTTHGRSGFTRWVLGSVTEKVLRAATVPMLVVQGSPARKPRGAARKKEVRA